MNVNPKAFGSTVKAKIRLKEEKKRMADARKRVSREYLM